MSTDLRTCKYCRTRIIFPRTPDGKKMPAVDYGPDPLGTVAVARTAAGEYAGRFLARAEDPTLPEHRHALHWCDGLQRQRQRGNWTSALSGHARQRRNQRRKRPPGDMLPGMGRVNPRETP